MNPGRSPSPALSHPPVSPRPARARSLIDWAKHPGWRHFRFALCAFVAWRAALFLTSWVAWELLPHSSAFADQLPAPFGPDSYWDGWVRWDALHYHEIARRGYSRGDITPAFFPLFPHLARVVAWVVGDSWVALLLTANLGFLLGLWVFYRLALLKFDESGARRAVAMLLFFPASFFFGAAYSESVYFCCVAASFLFFERGDLRAAALCGALAALARSTGFLLMPAFLVALVARADDRPAGARFREALWLLAIPLGLAAFASLLWFEVGSFTAMLGAQESWGRRFMWPWDTIRSEAARVDWSFAGRDSAKMTRVVNLLGLALGWATVVPAWRRLGPAYAVFGALVLFLFLTTMWVEAGLRVVMSIPTVTLVLAASTTRRHVEHWVLFGFALALALLTARFVNGFWMT